MSVVESWFAPASIAEPLPKPRRKKPAAAAPAAKRRAKTGRSFRVRAPLVWMAVLAFLLAGVVAVNVAVLQANVSVNDLDTQIAQQQQQNQQLATKLASVEASPRVAEAARRLGLVPVSNLDTGVIDMVRH